MQRIMYEIYRDRAAFLSHERQPHIRQFAVDRASCVLATNIIDLRLKYAKVAALNSAARARGRRPGGLAAAPRRPARPAPAATRRGAPVPAPPQYQPTQYQPTPYAANGYTGPQYQPPQFRDQAPPAAAGRELHPGRRRPGPGRGAPVRGHRPRAVPHARPVRELRQRGLRRGWRPVRRRLLRVPPAMRMAGVTRAPTVIPVLTAVPAATATPVPMVTPVPMATRTAAVTQGPAVTTALSRTEATPDTRPGYSDGNGANYPGRGYANGGAYPGGGEYQNPGYPNGGGYGAAPAATPRTAYAENAANRRAAATAAGADARYGADSSTGPRPDGAQYTPRRELTAGPSAEDPADRRPLRGGHPAVPAAGVGLAPARRPVGR